MKTQVLRFLTTGIVILASCRGDVHNGKAFLRSDECDEISGITRSEVHPGILYIHNDSGDINRFFAIDTTGKLLSTVFFQVNGENDLYTAADCEDIALGPGPDAAVSYVYIGDIGDNLYRRSFITIYRIPEPKRTSGYQHLKADSLNFTYPDGPRDAETLMIDARSRQFYILSKREDSVHVYSAPLGSKAGKGPIQLTARGRIGLEGRGRQKWLTSGEISADGSQIVLRTYNTVYMWDRERGQTVENALRGQPREIAAPPEPDGEAICFAAGNTGLYSVSEGKGMYLNFIPLPVKP